MGCYAPLIFDACVIEILARRLCCDDQNDQSSFADFDADSSDTNPS